MREIFIQNQEILSRLNGFIDTIKDLDPGTLPIENRDFDIKAEYGTSKEYLEHLMEKGHKGWPQAIKGIDIGVKKNLPEDWLKLKHEMSNEFTRELGAQQNALCCYYPSDGFIGWHDNHDVPGFTILFNWSEKGTGFYRYRDVVTGEIMTIQDKPGWSCKTGTYGDGNEYPRQWHCARSYEPRWSIAFYIRNQIMVDIIVEEIEYPDG